MAIENYNKTKSTPFRNGEIEFYSKETIPTNRILHFDYSEFNLDRIALARRQIEILIDKTELHPHLRSYCTKQINYIILFERGEIEDE